MRSATEVTDPSAGFPVDHSVEADFTEPGNIRLVVQQMLKTKLDKHTVLNVNILAVPAELIKGGRS